MGTPPLRHLFLSCYLEALPMTPKELIMANIAVLRAEADEAHHLASALDDSASIANLFKCAETLEADADLWELDLRCHSQAA